MVIRVVVPGSRSNAQPGRGGLVSLKVNNLPGREVATLINEYLPAGDHEIEFDAGSLPGSLYFHSLTTGDYVATKTMILIRKKS